MVLTKRTASYHWLVLAGAAALLAPGVSSFSPLTPGAGLRSTPAHRTATAPAPLLRTPSLLQPPALRHDKTGGGVALNMDFYPGLGETEVAYDADESLGSGGLNDLLFGPTQEEVDRKKMLERGEGGLALYQQFREHLNTHYKEELKCIALVMHDPDEEQWVDVDGRNLVQHAEVISADSRGFDISVSVCDDASCWLTMVHARLPVKAESAETVFQGFDTICDRCLCDPPDTVGICKLDEEILPEFYTVITKILNTDFLVEVNATITELAGVRAENGEYISRISVDSVKPDGFMANVYFCNFNTESCSSMAVEVKFPRVSIDADDLQDALAQCLEDGTCSVGDIRITDPTGCLDRWRDDMEA